MKKLLFIFGCALGALCWLALSALIPLCFIL